MKPEASQADPKGLSRRSGTPTLCRLFVLLARDNPVGVILRRGPWRWVQLIKWHTNSDNFEPGQWLHARVREHRCDLSPAGDLFVYHAYKPPATPASWAAVSRPPWFTALAFWPHAYGGLFLDQQTLYLEWVGPEFPPKFETPRFQVVSGEGHFLGDPTAAKTDPRSRARKRPSAGLFGMRDEKLWRTGWRRVQKPPEIWTKASPDGQHLLEMHSSLIGPGKPPPTDWPYDLAYTVRRKSDLVTDLAGATWADWDHRGDLVFARDGRLFRQGSRQQPPAAPQQIADFNDHRPQSMRAPPRASRW